MADIVPFDPAASMVGTTIPEGWVARQFANMYQGKLAYCHNHKAWFQFDGAIWKRQETPVAYNMIHEMASELSAKADAKNLVKMQSAAYAEGVEKLAKSSRVFRRTADAWDPNLWIAGIPGGAVDLRTGNAIQPRSADMITKSLAVVPDEFENCPLWENFLTEAAGGDKELIRFLQQICGYSLTGDTSEQALFFIFGPGGNGKGVFLSTVQGILGDYSVVAPMEALESQKNPRHATDIAMMRGARLVSASETKKGAEWDQQRVTNLTGGDRVTARFMARDNFTFTPQFTLVIIGNHKPTLSSVDDAMRRRLNMIPFTLKPKTKDVQLAEKLKSEWPGILRWMINGCVDWQENGLVRPAVVVNATAQYFDDQNTMEAWLDAKCRVDRTNFNLMATSAELYKSWSEFAKAGGNYAGTSKGFKPDMENLGFRYHRTASFRGFQGIEVIYKQRDIMGEGIDF